MLPTHGRNLVGDAGDVSPHFFRRGDIICHVPPLFSLRVCVWRGFKTKYDVCHVLCEEFFMLDVAHSHVDVEIGFTVFTDSNIFINFYFQNDF